VGGPVEPEVGDLAQHLALARDRIGQDHIECAQAVGGHDQQVVPLGGRAGLCVGGQAPARDLEDVADLAAVAQVQTGKIGLQQRGGHLALLR
jgi:hypothetical protein